MKSSIVSAYTFQPISWSARTPDSRYTSRSSQPSGAVEPDRPPLVDARHVGAERLGQEHQHDDVEDELEQAVRSHWKISGFSSAITR